jgi:hypothetical protein
MKISSGSRLSPPSPPSRFSVDPTGWLFWFFLQCCSSVEAAHSFMKLFVDEGDSKGEARVDSVSDMNRRAVIIHGLKWSLHSVA